MQNRSLIWVKSLPLCKNNILSSYTQSDKNLITPCKFFNFSWFVPHLEHNEFMKSLLIALSFLLIQNAQSVVVKSAANSKDGTHIRQIFGSIELEQVLPSLKLTTASRIYVASSGGNPGGVAPLLRWLRSEVRKASIKPIVIVRKACESSCISLLAGLNQMASQGRIELIIDSATRLGFHGCSRGGVYYKDCTVGMMKEQMSYGLSLKWINQHLNFYIYPTKGYIVNVKVRDPLFRGSGLFDEAIIEDNTLKYL